MWEMTGKHSSQDSSVNIRIPICSKQEMTQTHINKIQTLLWRMIRSADWVEKEFWNKNQMSFTLRVKTGRYWAERCVKVIYISINHTISQHLLFVDYLICDVNYRWNSDSKNQTSGSTTNLYVNYVKYFQTWNKSMSLLQHLQCCK